MIRPVSEQREYEYHRSWVEQNREKVKAYRRAYYLRNKKACLSRSEEWRKAHPEKVKQYRKKYEQTHREEMRELWHRRYERKKDAAEAERKAHAKRVAEKLLAEAARRAAA